MSSEFNIAIVGGGIVGCCVARELSEAHEDIYLFERNSGITRGENQSSRNSGVNHAGIYYDRKTRPLKARFCVEGNRLWYEFCERYDLPCSKTGKLMVAANEEESRSLDFYLKRAGENGVPEVRKISGDQVRGYEPNVRAHSALLLPTSGIFEPAVLVRQNYVLAGNNGVQFMTETEVVGLKPRQGGTELRIRYRDGNEDTVKARLVVNAAGLQAVALAKMLDPAFPIKEALVRGDSLKFYRTRRPELFLRGMNVYPTPIVVDTPTGKQHTVGVHLTPTFDLVDGRFVIGDTVTVGPKLIPVAHLDDYKTPVPPPEVFLGSMGFFPDLKPQDLEPHQSGIQARLNGYPDFYIEWDQITGRVVHLIGLDSPGLTSAPAIAKYVRAMIEKRRES
jgi:glycerol-3-phosphate dehydrogenase